MPARPAELLQRKELSLTFSQIWDDKDEK